MLQELESKQKNFFFIIQTAIILKVMSPIMA